MSFSVKVIRVIFSVHTLPCSDKNTQFSELKPNQSKKMNFRNEADLHSTSHVSECRVDVRLQPPSAPDVQFCVD